MRPRLIAKLLCAAVWINGAALGCSWFTSNDDTGSQAADEQLEVNVPDGAPEELDTAMRDAAGQVERLIGNASSAKDPERDAKLTEQLFTGVTAADKLIAHPDAAADKVDDARKAKLALLYIGAREAPPRFESRFGEFVQELIEEVPESPIAAVSEAAWLEVKHVTADESPETVLPLLTDYATKYPDRREGIQLFEAYADSLARRGRRDDALRCCRLGLAYYEKHSLVGRLRLKRRQIERMPPQRK